MLQKSFLHIFKLSRVERLQNSLSLIKIIRKRMKKSYLYANVSTVLILSKIFSEEDMFGLTKGGKVENILFS